VYVPKGYSPEKPLPSILFLHGSGEQGDDGRKQTTVGLGAAIKLAEDKWNFIVMFPQKPPGRGGFMDHEKLILDIMEKTQKEYKIDEKRQYITGLSMGGMGTWSLICKYPDKWAAAAPVCAWSNRLSAGSATGASRPTISAFTAPGSRSRRHRVHARSVGKSCLPLSSISASLIRFSRAVSMAFSPGAPTHLCRITPLGSRT